MKPFKFLSMIALFWAMTGASSNQAIAQCSTTNLMPVTITLNTDANPQETSFQLRDLTTGNIVFSVSSSQLTANGTFSFSTCVIPGNCLKAELIDSGLNGGPSMTIGIPGATFSSSNPGVFDQFETILVGGSNCTDLDDLSDLNEYVVRAKGDLKIGSGNRFDGSVAGGTEKGDLCMGGNNYVMGWLLGGEVGYGSNTTIVGLNGVNAFGAAPAARPCGSNSGPTINDLHILPNPFGNTNNCELLDILPKSDNDLYVPPGVTTVLNDHIFNSIVVAEGGILMAHPGKYYGGELIIDGGKLLPAAGGGGGSPLCDIFFQFSKVTFSEGSYVRAIINCEEVKIGDNNSFEGILGILGPNGGEIGDNNVFSLPDCPACVEASKTKKQGLAPELKPNRFNVVPHPVQGRNFAIKTQEVSFPADFKLYDLSGKLVQQQTLSDETHNQIELTGELPSGLYLCKLASYTGDTLTRKITLQRE